METTHHEIIGWMTENPFLGSLLFAAVLYQVASTIKYLFVRLPMVLVRGWPPPHLDAYGNWRPKDDEDE